MRRMLCVFVLMVGGLAAVLVCTAPPAFAQATTATIFGSITDASGAAVPGAEVTATNVETNVTRSATTGADGSYQLVFLPIGTYRVDANARGFKKFEQTGIVLDVNRNARVDAVLQVGAVSETVEVTSDAPLVDTKLPVLGQTVNNEDIENLPLVDRDVYSLLTLTAGVDTTSEATDNFGAPMRVTLVNGSAFSHIGSVNYTLDGGSNMNGLRNTGNVAPNPDAIEQFRVMTNSFSAEYGRFSGGAIDIITKSGTNRLHGSLFEFLRNDKLNANRWLPGQSALRKDPLHRNQFGGSVGGPIIHDRTFYFFSYSGLRQRTTTFANTATPFTAAERRGDLSATGGTAPVDPLTNTAFPGRQIPTARFDPVAKRIMDEYIPLPNLPGNLYEAQVPHPKNSDETQIKIDHVINPAHRITGSYFHTTGMDAVGLQGNLPWLVRSFVWAINKVVAGDTWIVSSNKVNQFNIQYNRNFGGRVNLPAISLGDLGSAYKIQGTPSLPQISVSGRFNLTSGIPGPVAGSNQYQLRDTLNITTGKHSISLGGEAILEKMIHDTLLNNYGVFSFSTNNARGTKNATADFLLGLPNTMNQDAPTTKIDNTWYWSLFFQDDYRVAPRLTVNLGVRYDLQTPITDPHDRFLTFIPGVQSKIVTIAPLGLLFPGDPGVGRGIIAMDKNNIGPRIGIALDPFADRKTSIRAGFGVFYGSIAGNQWNSSSDNQPFAIRQQFNNVKSLADPYGLLPGGVSPFPYGYSPSAARFYAPSAVSGISLDYRWSYAYQTSFSVQRQVGRDASFTAAYVSTLVHRVPTTVDLNYPLMTAGATTNNVDSRRPYLPGILSSIGMSKGILNSSYHGLQITGEKRYSRNFSLKGFYTFGKGLDVTNTQASTTAVTSATDWNNLLLDRGRTNGDRRHRFNVNGIWRLNYVHKLPAPARAVAGGWSLSFILSAQSGTPLTITAGSDRNLDGNNNDRANLIGDPVLDAGRPRNQLVDKFFNIAAFAQPANGTTGNAGRNIIDGPGLKNVDLGIFRDFRLMEGKTLQFRGEMTNACNLVNLSSPGTSAGTSSTFGKISSAGPMRQVQLGLRLTF
jgi:hypothetical protein